MAISVELSRVLLPERVMFLESSNKKDALEKLIACLASAPEVKDPEKLAEGIFYREELMSTGIGMGIAVPHVRLDSVEKPVMSVGICRKPLTDYESLDGKPVNLIFMIVAGKNQHVEHIRLLADISSKLKNEEFRNALINAADEADFYLMLTKKDK